MQIKIRTLAAALSLLSAACTDSTAPEERPMADPEGRIRVSVGAAPGIEALSRTQIDPDGAGVRWMPGDRIALWAVGSRRQTVLDAQPFELLHYAADYRSARFVADIAPMEEDTYTYYAVSPVPAAAEGTKAGFDIPATQNGSRQLACDVMVAAPVADGRALTDGDNSEALNLTFSHKVHVLKIHIPANRMGQPVERLTLTFPVPVTGRLTVDAADPDAAPVLDGADANRTLTLDFGTPQDAGATVFAVIAPVELAPEQEIEIKAYAAAHESVAARMPGKNYRAGHTTPVNLTVPERYRITRILFSLAGREGALDLPEDLAGGYGCSTLGEGIESFTVTDVQTGEILADFPAVDAENRYEIAFEGVFEDRFSGREVLVTFSSPRARVAKRFTLPQIEADASNTLEPFAVPYLFEEDFSSTPSFGHDDNNGLDATSAGSSSHTDLAAEDGMPDGWTGARCGGAAGQSVRICSRNECAAGVRGSYHGRIDSPALTGLREGTEADVTVTFSYAFARNSKHNNFLQPYLAAGLTDGSGRDTSGKTWGTLFSNGNPGTILQHNITAALHDLNDGGALDGSFDFAANGSGRTATYTARATRGHRLVWEVYMKEGEPKNASKYYYSNNHVYIDNIRVSLAR